MNSEDEKAFAPGLTAWKDIITSENPTAKYDEYVWINKAFEDSGDIGEHVCLSTPDYFRGLVYDIKDINNDGSLELIMGSGGYDVEETSSSSADFMEFDWKSLSDYTAP